MSATPDEQESYEFDPSISEEEREFYRKAYPTPGYVRDRRTHCTTCKVHIGTAPIHAQSIKMHPILRVTHCTKCHDFYNSGEFSKGEDGSELYCRWCGQGGEVYCCSSCPYVFCKSCITKNLSRGVVADIEQNENWRCFACSPKILWPLRGQHWALMNYIEKQTKDIEAMNLSEAEKKVEMSKDRSNCCRLAKAKLSNLSDSLESIESVGSRRSHNSSSSAAKKKPNTPSAQGPAAKKLKSSNDEVVCTPDLLSMLEPDCQITVPSKPTARPAQTGSTTPKIFTIQPGYNQSAAQSAQRSSAPPPLVLRNTGIQLRPVANSPVIRRTVVSPRTPSPASANSPVYHTINGFRIDLNSAAQQETFRLPNGKLIQVKRQSAPVNQQVSPASPAVNNWQQPQRSVPALHAQSTVRAASAPQRQFVAVPPPTSHVALQQQQVRYPSGVIGSTMVSAFNQNGPQIQMINGTAVQQPATVGASVSVRPVMVRVAYPDTAIGQARSQLQDQVFSAMEICQHLTGKIQTLTLSNAYKQARNYLEVKELYIHLSYLLTYAIGRFKTLQDKCLADMRQLGFVNDADSLENGQLAAGVDYVRYGQLEDVELFNTGSNSFHNQVYEYRKSLLANLDNDSMKEPPLSPLFHLNGVNETPERADWNVMDDDSKARVDDAEDDDEVTEVPLNDDGRDQYMDEDPQDETETGDDDYFSGFAEVQRSTEDAMRREEESHAYDRKLTRLLEQYPSIWCTRHPDYGNFEVTRKQWRTVAAHFKRSEDIKMRWKNIRKRYVRIERRIQEGKRFNGYFDKATNYLANRDLPMSEWVEVDCGVDDGDVYERKQLDAMERELHKKSATAERHFDMDESLPFADDSKPIEIRPLDMKIITFVKCNPVLWRKSSDPTYNKMDEQTRKSLWMHLWKSVPNVRCEQLVDRWVQMYEMYKTFRLKTIKSESALASLELKYSKYLAKLYFLYKIDEEELQSEYTTLIYGDDMKENDVELESETKLLDMPDDKNFVQALMRALREYPQIWNPNHVDYHDIVQRELAWQNLAKKLERFKQKQASDDEDIEIVEPQTDTINLDSDNEDETTSSTLRSPLKIMPTSSKQQVVSVEPTSTTSTITLQPSVAHGINDDPMDFLDAAHNILASMLEVDIIEGTAPILSPGGGTSQKKQPRKKTTNKPNPTLLKQKKLMERQRLEELKRNDQKLKLMCAIKLNKAEELYPYVKRMLEERKLEIQAAKRRRLEPKENEADEGTALGAQEDNGNSESKNVETMVNDVEKPRENLEKDTRDIGAEYVEGAEAEKTKILNDSALTTEQSKEQKDSASKAEYSKEIGDLRSEAGKSEVSSNSVSLTEKNKEEIKETSNLTQSKETEKSDVLSDTEKIEITEKNTEEIKDSSGTIEREKSAQLPGSKVSEAEKSKKSSALVEPDTEKCNERDGLLPEVEKKMETDELGRENDFNKEFIDTASQKEKEKDRIDSVLETETIKELNEPLSEDGTSKKLDVLVTDTKKNEEAFNLVTELGKNMRPETKKSKETENLAANTQASEKLEVLMPEAEKSKEPEFQASEELEDLIPEAEKSKKAEGCREAEGGREAEGCREAGGCTEPDADVTKTAKNKEIKIIAVETMLKKDLLDTEESKESVDTASEIQTSKECEDTQHSKKSTDSASEVGMDCDEKMKETTAEKLNEDVTSKAYEDNCSVNQRLHKGNESNSDLEKRDSVMEIDTPLELSEAGSISTTSGDALATDTISVEQKESCETNC